MLKEFGRDLRVAYLPEVLACLIVILPLKFNIPGGNPGNRLGLSCRTFRVGAPDGFANPASPGEIQGECAEPSFAEIEEPGIVRVLLGHFFLRPYDAQNLSELTQIQQSECLSTEC